MKCKECGCNPTDDNWVSGRLGESNPRLGTCEKCHELARSLETITTSKIISHDEAIKLKEGSADIIVFDHCSGDASCFEPNEPQLMSEYNEAVISLFRGEIDNLTFILMETK